MAAVTNQIIESKLLIGEGVEEVRFFKRLLADLNLSGIQVEEYGGKMRLARYLKELTARPEYPKVSSLGILRDADINADSTFQSVVDTVRRAGLTPPTQPKAVSNGIPCVRAFILPNNRSAGMLEDLCLSAVAQDPAVLCVDEYFDCLNKKTNRKPNNIAKARVHAWLASQIEPDKRLGEAAEAGYWPWDSPAFDSLKSFLRSL